MFSITSYFHFPFIPKFDSFFLFSESLLPSIPFIPFVTPFFLLFTSSLCLHYATKSLISSIPPFQPATFKTVFRLNYIQQRSLFSPRVPGDTQYMILQPKLIHPFPLLPFLHVAQTLLHSLFLSFRNCILLPGMREQAPGKCLCNPNTENGERSQKT